MMNWSWELWEWTAGWWRGRPAFAAMFPNSFQMCVCVCVHVSVCECVHWSLFSTVAKSLFPAKSKVGGGCISTSLHYRERWGGGGGWRRHICNKTGRNWKTLTHKHTHTGNTHTPALSDTWRNNTVSTNLFPQENRSTSSSASPVEPHPLLQQTHILRCLPLEELEES